MRLSLRTLLAFEDNIFDTEHRLQLERTIPKYDGVTETLRRLRSVVRNSRLGVPGIVDQREELDPNLVAEYLDHQLAAEHLDKFEAYCLSSDTYLAEVASVHQILSNVLGEPARTSRDCRLRCYDVGRPRPELATLAFNENIRTVSVTTDHYVRESDRPVLEPSAPAPVEVPADVPEDVPEATPSSSKNHFWAWLLILFLFIVLGSFIYWQSLPEEKKRERTAFFRQSVQRTTDSVFPSRESSPASRAELGLTGVKSKQEPPQPETAKKDEPRAEPPKIETAKKDEPRAEPPQASVLSIVDSFSTRNQSHQEALFAPPTDPFLSATPSQPSEQPTGFEATEKKVETSPVPQPVHPATQPEISRHGIRETTAAQPLREPLREYGPQESAKNVEIQAAGPSEVELKTNPLREALPATVSTDKRSSPLFGETAPFKEPLKEPFKEQGLSSVPVHQTPNDWTANQTKGGGGDRTASPTTSRSVSESGFVSEAVPEPIDFPERPRVAFQQRTVERSPEPMKQVSLPPPTWNSDAPPSAPHGVVQAQNACEDPGGLLYPSPRSSEVRTTRYEATATSEQTLTAMTFGETVPLGTERKKISQSPAGNAVGRLLDSSEPVVLFTAPSANEQWKKGVGKIPLHPDQYLLTLAPFRANVELAGKFRIEMVGDSKLCLLPPDARGTPGVFIDYGRIVIRPLTGSTASLRIQTEKTAGVVTLGGKSLLFVDTFAEILPTTPEPNVPLTNTTTKNNAILGLLPDPTESMTWFVEDQGRPFTTNAQTSVLLEKNNSDRGAIRNLPNWLQPVPISEEGKTLAAVCQKAFEETHGNCEAALELISKNPSVPIRAFGQRLWGDLGRFDVPLQLLARTSMEDEPVRQILALYFREVMKRDAETVQRLADAVDTVRR